MFKLITLLTIVTFTALYAKVQPQESPFAGLEKYLNEKMVGPESIPVIKKHLIESGTSDPLSELVAWAKAGFPDLHDEHGIWKTESISLKLGVIFSIHYYFSTSPPENKSEKYLSILKELDADDYIEYHLTGTAYWVVDEKVLEGEVLKLLQQKDTKLRSQGVRMGAPLAEQKRHLFEHYARMVKSDDDARVRLTVLHSMVSWTRRKDVAYVAFERLINDPSHEVRDIGFRGLHSAARSRVLTEQDLAAILRPMLKTDEPFVRISLGRVAARLTTDQTLWIEENKITDELLAGFIKQIKLSEAAGESFTDEELNKAWWDWWTPLIPTHAKPIRRVHE